MGARRTIRGYMKPTRVRIPSLAGIIEIDPSFWDDIDLNAPFPIARRDCDVCRVKAGERHRLVHMTTHVLEYTENTETGEVSPLLVRCVDWPYGEEPGEEL